MPQHIFPRVREIWLRRDEARDELFRKISKDLFGANTTQHCTHQNIIPTVKHAGGSNMLGAVFFWAGGDAGLRQDGRLYEQLEIAVGVLTKPSGLC